MICVKCGANNPSESAYCGGCGSFLVPGPGVGATSNLPGQEAPVLPPPEPIARSAAASVGEDMPTFHTVQPTPAQNNSVAGMEEVPTMRAMPAQPTPGASEFMNVAPANPQGGSGVNNPPVSPAFGTPQASGPLPVPAPVSPGALYPPQGPVPAPGFYQPQVPGYPGAVYPQQGAVPVAGYPGAVPVAGYPGAVYPPNTPQPVPGAFPPATPMPGFPSGAYPQQEQVSGALPPATPMPGFPSGTYPQQGQVSGVFPPATPVPGFPSGAYPQQGQFSGVFPPQVNEVPAGAWPGSMPGQPMQGSWGAYGQPPAGVPTAQPSKLISPLPLWAFVVSILVVVALLAGLTFFTGADWAAGAQTAGIVSLILGTLLLIVFGVRAALGMLVQTNTHRRSQIVSSLLLTLLLIAFGAIGLTQQAGIHTVQAHALEGQHNWQMAINEYQNGGQSAPSSEDIARTYNSWGDQLVNEQQYADGIAKFETVTSNYTLAASGFAQAKAKAITAYQQWAQVAVQAQRYDLATQHYDKLLSAAYCDSSCQTTIGSADANAYYQLAEQKLNQQPPDYTNAVAAFNQLTTRFSSSPSSQKAHADYAKALWGDGQQLVNTTCTSALTIYQQLSSQFSDTAQGQQATQALTQPVKVKGHFTSNIPGGTEVPAVALTQGTSAGMSTNAFYAILNKSPIALVKSDGTFVFTNVKQGSYYLDWGTLNQSAGQEVFMVSQRYPASAGPLCGFDFGDINESFPKA